MVPRSLREEGFGYLSLVSQAWYSVPGWLDPIDARFLYALAHHGPGAGVIVEIGSAWGKSTVFLARGSKNARRERVYAVDPHTGDPRFLDGRASAPGGLRAPRYRQAADKPFSTWQAFRMTIRRFDVVDWVVPVLATSAEAATNIDTGPIRLLYIDGLHTYSGVKADIDAWVSRLITGGIVVFDDYFNPGPDVGVRLAVDELLTSGIVEPSLQRGGRLLVWTVKR
jgi:predicted O-methyltransferase YrrM